MIFQITSDLVIIISELNSTELAQLVGLAKIGNHGYQDRLTAQLVQNYMLLIMALAICRGHALNYGREGLKSNNMFAYPSY